MPSSMPTAGRYPSSRWARRRSAAVSRTSPGWSPWRSIRTSRPTVRPISSIKWSSRTRAPPPMLIGSASPASREAGGPRRLEPPHRARHVRLAIRRGVLEGGPHPRAPREVQYDRHALERERITDDVRLDEPEARGPAQPIEVPLLYGPGVEGIEVVDAHHFVTPGEERFAHVRADEAGRARDEQTGAHAVVSPLKYSMVRRSPSSSEIFGSQPRVSRARWISGWRTFGSSVGRGDRKG